MAHIKYAALTTEEAIVINSEEFRSVLRAHPNLALVTVEETNQGKEILHKMTLPLTDDYDDFVAVVDQNNENAFMWVINDNWASVTDPSPAFIEILKVMDAYFVKTWHERLYTPRPDERLYADHPEILASTFDFSTGEYIRHPQSNTEQPNPNSQNNTQKAETMTEPKDVELMYFGYEYTNFDFINSQEVQDFLAKYDHLKMVMETFDPETEEEIIKELTFPFNDEAEGPIWLLDTRLDEADYEAHALLIHHQDDAFIMNPSPEFIEFLKMMQADFTKNGDEFFVKLLDQDDEDEDEQDGEFNFDTFTYTKPAN